MYENCIASSCHQILNGYMYKCSRLSNLHAVLKQTNQLDDPQWKKYLQYKPIHYSNSRKEYYHPSHDWFDWRGFNLNCFS